MDEKLKMSDERLFTDKEVQDLLDPQRGGKGLFWNNLYKDIKRQIDVASDTKEDHPLRLPSGPG